MPHNEHLPVPGEMIYTTGEAATFFRVHSRTIVRWIHEGRLGAFQPTDGGPFRIPASAVRALAKMKYGPIADPVAAEPTS